MEDMKNWETIEIGDELRDEYCRLWECYPEQMRKWREKYSLRKPGLWLSGKPLKIFNLEGIETNRDVIVPLESGEITARIDLRRALGPQLEDIRKILTGMKEYLGVPTWDKSKPRNQETTRRRIRIVHAKAQGVDDLDLGRLYPKVAATSLQAKVHTDFNEIMEQFRQLVRQPTRKTFYF